jgi:hypothetical protein
MQSDVIIYEDQELARGDLGTGVASLSISRVDLTFISQRKGIRHLKNSTCAIRTPIIHYHDLVSVVGKRLPLQAFECP